MHDCKLMLGICVMFVGCMFLLSKCLIVFFVPFLCSVNYKPAMLKYEEFDICSSEPQGFEVMIFE